MRWLVGAVLLLGVVVARGEDEAEGEDGVQFEDDTIYRAVIESCSGWRLNKVCDSRCKLVSDFCLFSSLRWRTSSTGTLSRSLSGLSSRRSLAKPQSWSSSPSQERRWRGWTLRSSAGKDYRHNTPDNFKRGDNIKIAGTYSVHIILCVTTIRFCVFKKVKFSLQTWIFFRRRDPLFIKIDVNDSVCEIESCL